MADTFDREAAKLLKNMNIKKNEMLKSANITPSQKANFRQDITEFTEDLNTLNEQFTKSELNPRQFSLSQKEIASRKKQIESLFALKTQLEETLSGSLKSAQNNLFNNQQPSQKQFKDTYATPETSNEQVQKNYEEQSKNQLKYLDQMNDNVVRTKHVGIKIGDELDAQNQKLEDLEQGIDQNTIQMMKTTDKMKKLIKESSTCGILITIFVEIAILVVIILYM